MELETQQPPEVVFRLGRKPDPWQPPPWSLASSTDGTFGNRFDDPEGYYRVLYASTQRLACFVETLARFRPDLSLLSELSEIDGEDDYTPLGSLPVEWLQQRMMGQAELSGSFADIYSISWVNHLRRTLAPEALRLGFHDVDASTLERAEPRRLTQLASREVYRHGFDGIYYQSRYGHSLKNWAIFEPFLIRPGISAIVMADDADFQAALSLLWCSSTAERWFSRTRKKRRARMQNAHLRLGRFSYQRNTEKVHTFISVHVSHYIGEDEQAHLLSFFGNDAEVGAITAAIQEKHHFELHFPDGSKQRIGFGEDASCYKANLSVPQHKKSLRHVVAVSSWLHSNGSAGRIFLINGEGEAEGAAWSTLVNLLGLPADPRWGKVLLRELREEGKMLPLAGVGCSSTVIHATRNEMLERVGRAVAENRIPFPEKNGPITWPQFDIAALLSVDRPNSQTVELI